MAYPRLPAIVYPPVFGNGMYLKLDSYGNIATSVDQITWSAAIQPFGSVDARWFFNGAFFANGMFLIYGHRIVAIGSSLPGSSWQSTIVTGGNWLTCTVNSNNQWYLTDDEGRTATSADSYPGNWAFTRATKILPPTFEFDPMSNW